MNLDILSKTWLQLVFFKTDQIEFLEDFKELINSGIDEKDICINLVEFGSPSAKALAGDMLMAIRNGRPVTSGMQGWFSPIIISTIAAGQETGDIDMGLDVGINTLRDASGLTLDILNAVKYPAVMIVALLTVAGGPSYEYMLDMQNRLPLYKWGGISQAAWSLAEFSHNWMFFLMCLAITSLISLMWMLPNFPYRESLDNSIVFKQYRDLNAIAVLASVSSLMRAGVGINDCMSIIGQGSSRWLRAKIQKIKLKIASGKKNYGDVFDVGLLGQVEIQRIKILSNSEDIPSVLMQSSIRQRRRLKKQIVSLGKLANLLTMMAAGCGMAILAGGTYLVVAQSARVAY